MNASGQAKIVYAPQAFTAIFDRFGDAGIVALFAHALGHALDDGIGAKWVDPKWPAEVRADAWAGCVIARAGFSRMEIEEAMASLRENPSLAHPAWPQRLLALNAGFSHCGGAK
jgi:hypothetical protein